jgi:hypothetical protein
MAPDATAGELAAGDVFGGGGASRSRVSGASHSTSCAVITSRSRTRNDRSVVVAPRSSRVFSHKRHRYRFKSIGCCGGGGGGGVVVVVVVVVVTVAVDVCVFDSSLVSSNTAVFETS